MEPESTYSPQVRDAADFWIALTVIGCVIAVSVGIKVFISWIAWRCAKSIPAEHRQVQPWVAWLLLILGIPIVLNFFVFPAISKGFQNCFPTRVARRADDCGYQYGLGYSIAVACSILPGINCLTSIAAVILLLLTLFELSDCRKQALRVQKLNLGERKPIEPPVRSA